PELVAAIRASARRSGGGPVAPAEQPSLTWVLDLAAWRLSAPSGASVEVTRAEMQLLEMLSEQPGQPVSREAIARHMGKSPEAGDLRYVDAIVSRLRRKIIDTLGWDAPIRAAHAKGYRFAGTMERRG